MKKYKLIAGIGLVFILGVLAGSAGTQFYYRHGSERFWKDPGARRAMFQQRLTRELRLTEEQQKEFSVIVEEVDTKLAAFRRDTGAEIKRVIDESFTRMNEKLTPDQQQKLEESRAAHEERMKERKKRRPLS